MPSLGRVLVVDDEPEVGAVLNDLLTDMGYHVDIALRGRDALDMMRVLRPDVVLLDLTMPQMSGVAVFERLRREFPGVPVVIVSANEDEDLARSLITTGAFDYVKKPFDVALVERIVAAAVGHRR